MSYDQQMQMIDFFDELGVDYVNIATLNRDTGKMKGDGRARDRAEAEKCLGWAWHENRAGSEVYIRPARWLPDGAPSVWPVVFLDDLTLASAQAVTAGRRSLIVETSPGLHHVWIQTARALAETARAAAQRALAAHHGGDAGSVSGEHFGRLPGYKNIKRGGSYVRLVAVVQGAPLDVDALPAAPAPASEPSRPARACASALPAGGRDDLYNEIGGWSSESEREFGYVIGRLRWVSANRPSTLSIEADKLTQQIASQAEARGKRNPEDYARRTVSAALARI